jgi:hypothetical protein
MDELTHPRVVGRLYCIVPCSCRSLRVTARFLARFASIQFPSVCSTLSRSRRCGRPVSGGSSRCTCPFFTRSRPQPNPAARALIETGIGNWGSRKQRSCSRIWLASNVDVRKWRSRLRIRTVRGSRQCWVRSGRRVSSRIAGAPALSSDRRQTGFIVPPTTNEIRSHKRIT